MSNLLALFCMAHGTSDARPCLVEINKEDRVGKLQDLIQKKGPHCSIDIRVADLKLWRWNASSDEVNDSDLDDCKALDPRNTISDVFKDDTLIPEYTYPEPGK